MIKQQYIPGIGNRHSELMILGESPSFDELTSLSKNRELDGLLTDSGISKGKCWLSNVFKYSIPENFRGKRIPAHVRAKNDGINIEESLQELQNEINSIKPNCILALGSTALWALTGKNKIQNYRGSIIQGMGRKVVSTYNPKDLSFNSIGGEIKGYWNRQIIIFDFKRALHQSKFPEFNLPQRQLQVCKSSYELNQFIELYKDKIKLSVDIEAGGHCLPICIGLAFNKSHGITVPLWNKDNISTIPDSDLVQIWIQLSKLLYEKEIIGQNFNYDRDKIRRLGFIIQYLKSDTMLKAFTINPELPKGLAFNTSIYSEEPFYKDEGMYEGKINDLMTGCARDACVTYEINEKMEIDLAELGQVKFFYNFIMKLPELYLHIENQGFAIDSIKRDELLKKYIEWDERLRYELFKLCGTEVNVGSSKQVWILLFDILKCPSRNGTGEEELTSLLNLQSFTDLTKRKIIELILEDRRVRKSISTYLMALPDFDGRMRTTYFPCLETGRSSTGQQDPPIRPIIEVIDENGKKKKKVLGTAFQTITKHGDIGQDIRSMYVPG